MKRELFQFGNVLTILITLAIFLSFANSWAYSDKIPSPCYHEILNIRKETRISATVIVCPVSVIDKNSKPVANLDYQGFQLFDNDKEQVISFFSKKPMPISYGIVTDISHHPDNQAQQIKSSLADFLSLSRKGDQVFIANMQGDNSRILQEYTANLDAAKNALDIVYTKNENGFFNNLITICEYGHKGKNLQKALIIITDNQKENRLVEKILMAKLLRADEQFFIISLDSVNKNLKNMMNELAQSSGGRAFFINNTGELENKLKEIDAILRSQYIIGYYPSDYTNDDSFHQLRIKLKTKSHYRIFTRSGYYAEPREEKEPIDDDSIK